jgi:hypothetical protein
MGMVNSGTGHRLLGPDPTTRLALMIAATATFTATARRLGYGFGGKAPVRCRRGHLFTTLWIPGVNLKALDLGAARIQWCPVGGHWSLVTPLRTADLSADERRSAAAHHDLRIP